MSIILKRKNLEKNLNRFKYIIRIYNTANNFYRENKFILKLSICDKNLCISSVVQDSHLNSDKETYLSFEVPFIGEVEKPLKSYFIDLYDFLNIVSFFKTTDNIDIDFKENNLSINQEYSINYFDDLDVINRQNKTVFLPYNTKKVNKITFNYKMFTSEFKSLVHCASTDPQRYDMTNICFEFNKEDIRLVSTNGKALFFKDFNYKDKDVEVIQNNLKTDMTFLPITEATITNKILSSYTSKEDTEGEVEIMFNNRGYVLIRYNNFSIIYKYPHLLTKFMNYKPILPNSILPYFGKVELECKASELLKNYKLLQKKRNLIILEIKDNLLYMYDKEHYGFRIPVKCSVSKNTFIKFSINNNFIKPLLQKKFNENIYFYVSDVRYVNDAIVISYNKLQSAGSMISYFLVMPIRL